ncbi:hypothetical protein P1X15_27910 [Runella sp. MFBS21]|uniref:hypothetical protein n=1 Tax=Runella sp. MFBS21 TaxID=3034018 RepID=UPI0023F8FA35|nr:hypothetical protein [Runella sp. MFBS21]MDF7821476.1 hypothetical protein [Runella sp. MFBS21]
MNRLASFLNRISNWKTLLGLIIIYLPFPTFFFKNAEEKINLLAGQAIGPIDLTIGFTPKRTLQMVEAYGVRGREYYANVQMTLDVVYPLVYTLLLAVTLTLLYRKKKYVPFSYVNLLPFVVLIFDYLENGMIVLLLKSFPEQSYTVAAFCEIFKSIKWFSALTCLLLIIYGSLKILPKSKKMKDSSTANP